MITLVGRAPHTGGLVGTGGGIRVNGGTTVPVIDSWSRPSGILVPVPGRDGTSISIGGTVATYADLPSLAAADRGALYVVEADGLGYVWSGTVWPADGAGIEIRGEKGDRGLGIASIAVVGDSLRLTMTDGSVETVEVPALAAAAQSALAAAGSAAAADGHRLAAAGSAGEARTERAAAETAADAAEGSASAASTSASNAAGSASAAGGSASDAAGSASDAAGSASAASTSETNAREAETNARGSATDANTAKGEAAQSAASALATLEGFGIDASATASAPGSPAEVESVRDGLRWLLQFTLPRGDKGEPGEITQQELEDAITAVHLALVGESPETLRTIGALADALGDDPNFATTVMALIAEKAPNLVTLDTSTFTVAQWLGQFVAAMQTIDGAVMQRALLGHRHTGDDVDITLELNDGNGGTEPQTMSATAWVGVIYAGMLNAFEEMYARPAMFSGHGPPPASIPGAVVGDNWLNLTTSEFYKITGV